MDIQTQSRSIPIKIGQTHSYGPDQFVRVLNVEQGRWFYKVNIQVNDEKVQTTKIIKILNTRIFEFGNTLYLKGSSIEKVLVNGNEIL